MEFRRHIKSVRTATNVGSALRAGSIVLDNAFSHGEFGLFDLFPAALPLLTQRLAIRKLNAAYETAERITEHHQDMTWTEEIAKRGELNTQMKELKNTLRAHTLGITISTGYVAFQQAINAFKNQSGLESWEQKLASLAPLGIFLFGSFILLRANDEAYRKYDLNVLRINKYVQNHPIYRYSKVHRY